MQGMQMTWNSGTLTDLHFNPFKDEYPSQSQAYKFFDKMVLLLCPEVCQQYILNVLWT